jgi:hypothetical protein
LFNRSRARVAEHVGIAGVAAPALDWLRARHADASLPLLRLPAARDDLASIRETADRLRAAASDIVLLGTGGSSLGGQTLAQLGGHAIAGPQGGGPHLHFIDNLDPETFEIGRFAALGPVDQHSQLQLFIAGPRDKLVTIITTGVAGAGPRMASDLAELAGESGFAGKSIGDLVAAEGRATAERAARCAASTSRDSTK